MEFDLFYEVMVPAEWSEDIERRVYAETLEQLEFADTLGFNTAWIARHHGTAGFSHTSAPEVIFGALAPRTSKLRFGFGVELLPLVHPVFVAERTATVDLISDGRVEVGTGRTMGLNQLRLFGVTVESTRERWLESVRLLPRLWTETNVVHEGKYWQWHAPITTVPRPLQKPHPRLWVAASRNETARLAGEYGLGMLMSSFRSPADLVDDFTAYKEAIKRPTEQIGCFKNDQASVVTTAVCHDRNDSAARDRGIAASLYYLGKVRKGYGENQGAAASINTIPDEDVFEKGILRVGDPDYMIEAVKEYQAIGADRMMLLVQLAGLPHQDVMRSLELFGKRVIPQFQPVAVA